MNLLAIYIFSVIGMFTIINTKVVPTIYKKWYKKTDRIKMDEYLDLVLIMKIMTFTPILNTIILCFLGLVLWDLRGKK